MEKKISFYQKNFSAKIWGGGGHFDNAQNCRFFAMEVIFWPEMAESAKLFFSGHLRPPIITTIFFFEIDWIVVEECLFKVWKSKNRKKWFAPPPLRNPSARLRQLFPGRKNRGHFTQLAVMSLGGGGVKKLCEKVFENLGGLGEVPPFPLTTPKIKNATHDRARRTNKGPSRRQNELPRLACVW